MTDPSRGRALPWIPVALGLLGSVLTVLVWRHFYLRTWLPMVPMGIGAAISVAWLAGRRHRTRRQSAYDAGWAAARADRLRLLSRLDHEIKNPLMAAHAALANVAEGELTTAGRAGVASAQDQVARLWRLLGDLRKVTEVESAPLEISAVDLRDLLGEVVDVAADLPGASDRTVRLSIPEAPWPVSTVVADRDLLFLALVNLVANAVKFTRPDDTIEVRVVDADAFVVVEVADTGMGVPEGEAELVWEELGRGAGARNIPGSGMGLALVRTVAHRLGGRVELRSRDGRGTVVRVHLRAGPPAP